MSVYTLLFLTTLDFLFSVFIFRGDYLQPAVIFSFVFSVASLDLCVMKDFWDVSLSSTTIFVVVSGVLIFTIVSFIVEIILERFKIKKNNYSTIERKLIEVDNIICKMLFILYLVTIVVAFRYVIQIARLYGGAGGMGNLIGMYNGLLKGATTDDVSYPFYIQILTDVCGLFSYVWAYIIINNYSVDKKINKNFFLMYILGLIVSLISGSRGDAVSVIFASLCMAIIILRKTEKKKKTSKKFYIYFVIIFAVIIVTFQMVGSSLGRDSDIFTPFEYISIYLGAPILNLNKMISRVGGNNTIFFNYTFSGLYSSLGKLFGIKELTIFNDPMVHLASNGHRTGNVATTFFAYYYDGGIIGVIILTTLMAIIMQKMYKDCKTDRTVGVSCKTIFYTYFVFLTARSFFSNSLFNAIQLSLIKLIFIIIIESKYLTSLRFKKIKR